MDVNEFVLKCEAILAARGHEVKYGAIQGHIGFGPFRQYDDDEITIASGTYGGVTLFEVVVKYTADGFTVDNPCIMIKNGDMFRYHGDWRRKEEHVEKVLASL